MDGNNITLNWMLEIEMQWEIEEMTENKKVLGNI